MNKSNLKHIGNLFGIYVGDQINKRKNELNLNTLSIEDLMEKSEEDFESILLNVKKELAISNYIQFINFDKKTIEWIVMEIFKNKKLFKPYGPASYDEVECYKNHYSLTVHYFFLLALNAFFYSRYDKLISHIEANYLQQIFSDYDISLKKAYKLLDILYRFNIDISELKEWFYYFTIDEITDYLSRGYTLSRALDEYMEEYEDDED